MGAEVLLVGLGVVVVVVVVVVVEVVVVLKYVKVGGTVGGSRRTDHIGGVDLITGGSVTSMGSIILVMMDSSVTSASIPDPPSKQSSSSQGLSLPIDSGRAFGREGLLGRAVLTGLIKSSVIFLCTY